jgi:hypothetical protein
MLSDMGYSLAAKYPYEIHADMATKWVKRVLARQNVDLSVFQFHDAPYWYVAVVGEETDMKLFSHLARQLQRAKGQIIPLPEETHDRLLEMRATPQPPHPPQV